MKTWYAISPKPEKSETEISIFDEIGFWGVTAKDFISDLKQVPKDHTILLRIHSPGGEVFDGNAIFNALKRREADVIIQIEGLAASMATVISLAGHHVKMAANGFYMIHNPWGMAMGDAAELRDQAELLDKIRTNMVGAYAAKSGKSLEQIAEWMDAETWFTAEEAKAAGFVDEITEALPIAASADKFSRMAKFRHTPSALLTSPDDQMKKQKSSASAAEPNPATEPEVAATVVSESAPVEQPAAEPAPEVSKTPAPEAVEAPAPEAPEAPTEPQAKLAAADAILAKYNEVMARAEAAEAHAKAIEAKLDLVKSELATKCEDLDRLERSIGLSPARVVPAVDQAQDSGSIYDQWKNATGAEKTRIFRANRKALEAHAKSQI